MVYGMMSSKPALDEYISVEEFREYDYSKEELIEFCRRHGLMTTGTSAELKERTDQYLYHVKPKKRSKILLESIIGLTDATEEDVRQFYHEQIGDNFLFYRKLREWLEAHPQSMYLESLEAYHRIFFEAKNHKNRLEKLAEYKAYVKDFFQDNPDKHLGHAATCWIMKKNRETSMKYKREDLKYLTMPVGHYE